MKPVIPLAYSLTQAEITAGAANNIAKGTPIIVTDVNGQPIDIKTAQGSGQPPVEAAGIKNNFAATTAPGVGNDSTQGYAVGSRWINTTGDETYVCMDASSGAAVWEKTTAGTIAEIAGLQAALDGKSSTTHNHSGTYEPANANIQSHVVAAHAPSNAEQNVNADWNAASGDAQILNKPTIPSSISVKVTRSSAQSLASTGTIVSWDTVDHEVGATTLWDVATPTRLTAPVAGTYLVIADIAAESDAVGQVAIMKNGTVVHNGTTPRFWTGSGSTSALVRLSIGEYIECKVYPATTVNSIVAAERHYLAMVSVSS